MKAISCRFKSCHPHQQKESSTNSTAFFLPFRIAERLEPAVQPPGRRAPPFWRLLPPFPPLSGGIYLSFDGLAKTNKSQPKFIVAEAVSRILGLFAS